MNTNKEKRRDNTDEEQMVNQLARTVRPSVKIKTKFIYDQDSRDDGGLAESGFMYQSADIVAKTP